MPKTESAIIKEMDFMPKDSSVMSILSSKYQPNIRIA